MSMHPIETTETIKNDYVAYLQSILKVKDETLTRQAYLALTENEFVKGPFLEATPPFVTGTTLAKLIDQGVASKGFRFIEAAAEIHRPLYVHQETAFRKLATGRRNIIVATGTGSGKTECFMYPIFNELMFQDDANTLTPGIRALLLYPMNALANDQMKRLRELLANYPNITFGRYTGETLEKEEKAVEVYRQKKEQEFKAKNKRKGVDYNDSDLNPLPNELVSRQKMRETPPHILITNYAMLEYLLIRPEDTSFFDGHKARAWRFLVLDEAHTYKGANGTEIALLLRRLKERVCQNEKNVLQCIATSATLGNKEALPDLAAFASNIFDEKFEVEDIITSERRKRTIDEGMKKHSMEEYQDFKTYVQAMKDELKAGSWLYERLVRDERIVTTLNLLAIKPKNLKEVAKQVFADYSEDSTKVRGLILLIELGVMAKPDADSAALLPARYHLFVRALEGVYVALYPRKQVFLDRKELFDVDDKKVPVFELANCQNCGQEYLIGKEKNGYLKPAIEGEKLEYYMLTSEVVASDDVDTDSDDEAFETADVKKVEVYELCTICGKLTLSGAKRREECCNTEVSSKIIIVYKMKTKSKAREVNTCAACGGVSKSIIKRFMTANQPSTYIVANSLYSMIPPQKITVAAKVAEDSFFEVEEELKNLEYYDESGRKLLVFSDNRQEAAFFAAYMDNKYNQLMWRRLILRELKSKPEGILLEDLMRTLVKKAKDAVLYPDSLSNQEKEIVAATYLMKEFMGYERKLGLEGSGYLKFSPEKVPMKSGRWDLSADEVWEICCVIMDTLRYSGATTYPENIDPENESYTPRNRNVYFRKFESGLCEKGTISSFLPVGSANNRRYDYLRKVLETMGAKSEEAKVKGLEILDSIYENIIRPLSGKNYFERILLGSEGEVTRLNYKKWVVTYCEEEDSVYRCNRCGKITAHNVKNICPEFRCRGVLETISAKEFRNDPYYSKVYSSEKIIPMVAKEHTGQLNKDAAGTTQAQFEAGEINVLSCTTTFEMGVDVGQLEAILLRNVPPETANYVQRAGRAGRRTSATAFSVTYARRNSHDLNYFENPIEIISGKIKSPYIELNNDKIAIRHVNSIVLAWFFRRNEECKGYFKGNVRSLAGTDGGETILVALKQELEKQPEDLLQSIERVLPLPLMERLEIKKWSFVDKLIGVDGSLTNAIEEKQRDLEILSENLKKRNEKKQNNGDLIRLINTFEKQQTINFLASSGVIPKYGFPVDVVKLDIRSNAAEAKEVDLSRDLKLAISEYAPGSEIIAAGKVWTSHSINKIRDKEWPTYRYSECPDCGRTSFPDGITTIEEQNDEELQVCRCGSPMKAHKVIIPIFGFSTSWVEKAKKVGDSRPKRFYPTRTQFGGFDALDQYQEAEKKEAEIQVGDKSIQAKYSPQGKLVIMNKGTNGAGLFICKYCGYAKSYPQDFKHKNKLGHDCSNTKYPTNAALGQIFTSDILWLEFPTRHVTPTEGKDPWTTLLYAILEGASDALGVSREDINGCIDKSGNQPVVILFDEAPGGAGHVKRIYSQLEAVLKAAYRRVDGHCKCGEETTCYGCLRGYTNQLDHDVMARGMAKEYLEWLLLERPDSVVRYVDKLIEAKDMKKGNLT
ncbi:DEAD/DEAH box helicase [Desulfosporosinus sp. OT]|uniref:DEAD/DEAH box helicase n=1 Tax=Desulfosporosinus sp. OT TaxID=913865 RepID=UPI000223AD14|nr:DEAD/DEAH box helicase [Desulfosporosinus sp. OT]EGW41758.1 DEAD/DEAH box helicase family protein [Desulfosporosinus sp. OT]